MFFILCLMKGIVIIKVSEFSKVMVVSCCVFVGDRVEMVNRLIRERVVKIFWW